MLKMLIHLQEWKKMTTFAVGKDNILAVDACFYSMVPKS